MAVTATANLAGIPGSEPNRKRVIDLVHLAKQTLGDRGLEQEVLRIYDRIARGYYENMCNAESGEEVKVNLHSLKGASAGIGANGLAALARSAEEELQKNGKLSEETVADIHMALEEVSAYISELLTA